MNREELRTQVWKKNLTVLEKVEFILEKCPTARDDERILLEQYYSVFHDREIPEWILYGDEKEFVPQMHSVRRMARKVQNTFGKYQPSINQKHIREEISASHKSYHV